MLSWILVMTFIGLSLSCQPPDCQNVDCGTCVEACCKLQWNVTGTNAAELAKAIETSLKNGGPDGQYSFFGTAPNQGPLTFVVQGIHSTATMHYNDTLNFGIINGGATSCSVLALSHSQDFIVGDDGQNYKNLVQLMKGTNLKFEQTILFGCPAPK